MKRIIICAVACCILAACGVESRGVEMNTKGEFLGVVPNLGTYYDALPDTEFVLDEESALQVGDVVLKNTYDEENIAKCEFLVQELEGRDIFVVTRILPYGSGAFGGAYHVAIKKKGGEILKVWLTN